MFNKYDIEFLKQMIPHHKLALTMSAAVLKDGSDAQVLALAKEITDSQKKQIDQMTTWLDEIGEKPDKKMKMNRLGGIKMKYKYHTPIKYDLQPKNSVPQDNDGDAEDAAEVELPTLIGYPIIWGAITDGDSRRHRFAKNCVVVDPAAEIHALYFHDYKDILGTTFNGTLRLIPDNVGLRVEIDPPSCSYAKDVVELIEDNYVRGMSFGMIPLASNDAVVNGEVVTTFTSIKLTEVTITAIPAVSQTIVEIQDENIAPEDDQFSDKKSKDEIDEDDEDEEDYEFANRMEAIRFLGF
jgi:HK97 family phage prohead protease